MNEQADKPMDRQRNEQVENTTPPPASLAW